MGALPWVLGIGAAALAGGGLVRSFEGSAAREIAATLGGTPTVRVRTRNDLAALWGDVRRVTIEASGFSADGLPFFTEPERSQYAKVGRLDLRLRDFDLRGLRVESLEASIPGCRYDRGLAWTKRRFRLSRSGVGRGRVEITAEALTRWIAARYPAMHGLTLALDGDRARLSGSGDFLRFTSGFVADAALSSPDGRTIVLTDARIEIGGTLASPAASAALLRFVNPVLDLDRDLGLFGAVRVDRITTKAGRLVAEGAATIPVRPKG